MERALPQIQGRRDAQEKQGLKKILLFGLIFYTAMSCLGLFLADGLASPFLIPYLIGYLALLFIASYAALFRNTHLPVYHFLWLAAIGLNLIVQVSGGPASPARFVYILLVAGAVFLSPLQTYGIAAIVLVIEAANLYAAGAGRPEWLSFSGFGASLSVMAAFMAPAVERIKKHARLSRERYRKLIADAQAVDPLSTESGKELLSAEMLQAANISSAVEREGSFKSLIDIIYELVPAHTYAVFVTDKNDGMFTLRAIRSASRHVAPVGTVHVSRGSGLIGICLEKDGPQYLPELVIPARSLGYYTHDVPVKSFIAIPIRQGEKTVGAFVLDSLEPNDFSPDMQDQLARFAPFFSQIIEKIRISRELDLRARYATALHRMSAVLNSSFELSDILSRLSAEMNGVVPYDCCAFALYHEESDEMVIAAQYGYDPKAAGVRFPVVESAVMNQMFMQWKGRSVTEPYDFPDLGARGMEKTLFPVKEMQCVVRSLYCLPLVARDKFIGVFVMAGAGPDAFARHHKDFIETLMNQVSVVIDNVVMHNRIRDMATTDGLTGLLNHRTFMEKLDEEFRRLARDPGQIFSLLLLDIDHFKAVNDTYGHPVGDVVLKGVASIIREMVRSVDFVARYGGEEFAVGMVGAKEGDARTMGERIRKAVENATISAGRHRLKVTLSIGVAQYSIECPKREDLVARTDEALYEAKRTGRNRVCVYNKLGDK